MTQHQTSTNDTRAPARNPNPEPADTATQAQAWAADLMRRYARGPATRQMTTAECIELSVLLDALVAELDRLRGALTPFTGYDLHALQQEDVDALIGHIANARAAFGLPGSAWTGHEAQPDLREARAELERCNETLQRANDDEGWKLVLEKATPLHIGPCPDCAAKDAELAAATRELRYIDEGLPDPFDDEPLTERMVGLRQRAEEENESWRREHADLVAAAGREQRLRERDAWLVRQLDGAIEAAEAVALATELATSRALVGDLKDARRAVLEEGQQP